MTHALPRLATGLPAHVSPRAWANFVALTGTTLNAHDLVSSGFATHFVPSAQVEELVREIAETADPEQVLSRFGCRPPDTELPDWKAVPRVLAEHGAELEASFTEPSVEAIRAKLEALRTPWAEKVGAVLDHM